ncbi:MAG: ATP-dependent zinc metalloprotease FtsH [Oscillospiraceae bacterium]|nr:ATP-dependent zinc metalloprotease FtsH [Oscillospiraceae bacterium]
MYSFSAGRKCRRLKRSGSRNWIIYILIILVIVVLFIVLTSSGSSKSSETYADLRALFEQEQVGYFETDGDSITLRLWEKDSSGKNVELSDTEVKYPLADFDVFYEDMHDLIDEQWQEGIIEDYNYKESATTPWWVSMIPYVIIIIIFIALMYFFMRRSAGGGAGGGANPARFSRARTHSLDESDKRVTFNDVAGEDEEKAELEEVVEYLRDPQRFISLGARIPKGILLVGPPGTGKTLLARAVAGEANVHFLSISGSDFVELYVGVGASRVRDLFEQAKKESPAIIFIDEIDAVGRQRGTGLGGGHDEREQTLNQLLVEMDGFSHNEGVIVLAATNRVDILDPALLRPGRFDRQIYVGYPDIKGREEILRIHSRNKPLADDVSLADIAKATSGFTGADLENLMNEGALLAARKGELVITNEDLQEAVIKVIAGPEKRSKVVSEHAKKLTAYHEAGHALVINALETADPVHQISIVPRGAAGGMTISLPQEDKSFLSRLELTERITVCLGGRAAEEIAMKDISTGASNDIEQATSIARSMVTRYGMSKKLGTIQFESSSNEVFIGRSMAQSRTYSEEIAGIIDEEIHTIIEEALEHCRSILTVQRARLDAVADFLLEHETMTGDEFRDLCESVPVPGPGSSPAVKEDS